MRLLLIEDDVVLQDGLLRAFENSGYAVDIVNDGEQADMLLTNECYDVIILDLGLPRLDGFEVLHRFRLRGLKSPVLILTAFDDVESRVRGLDLGADDYLTKPFHLSELQARIRALVRRGISGGSAVISVGPLVIDTENRHCTVNGKPLLLTYGEFMMLELLILKANKVVSKSKITEHLCNLDELLSDNAIEANISRLRKKLLNVNVEIKTVRGMGYILPIPAHV
jgi:DNA-binding response OmpR family regulator